MVLYDMLKRELQHVNDSDDDDRTVSNIDLGKVDTLFGQYRQLEHVERPSLLHSLILQLACKAQKAGWSAFLDFVEWWNLDNIRDEDRQQVGKFKWNREQVFFWAISRVAKQLEPANKHFAWVHQRLAEALTRYPDDPWLNRAYAHMLRASGQLVEAVKHLRVTARAKRNDWWIWGELGEFLELAHEPKQALMCYAHACSLQSDPAFLVRVHQRMAVLLAREQRYREAAYYAAEASRIRQQREWKVPAELHQLLQSQWYKEHAPQATAPMKEETKLFAEMFIRGIDEQQLERRMGVIDHHNAEKGISFVLFSSHEGQAIPQRRFPQLKQLQPGSIVEVYRYTENDQQRILDVRPAGIQTIEGFVEQREGVFRKVESKNIGFVDVDKSQSVFVPGALTRGITSGMRVRVVACLKADRDNKRVSWVALRVSPIS
jgi:hypothetical protein